MRKRKKNTQKRVLTKKNQVRKEPYKKLREKKISTKPGKNFCMARYHTEENLKKPKTSKNTKLAECQADTQRRLFKKT